MKLFSLLSICAAAALCMFALPAITPIAVAQEVLVPVAPHDLVTHSIMASAVFALTVMAAIALVAFLFALVVRSDRSKRAEVDDDQILDLWALPDSGRSWPG